LGKLITFNHCF